jgi:hypothetical protein
VKRIPWPLLLVLLLAIPLTLLLQDFVREELAVELLRLFWAVRLLYQSLPQLPIWIAFLAFALIAAAGSLLRRGAPSREVARPRPEPRGRVRVLIRWIRRASEGEYFHWRLAQHLGAITRQVLAYQEHVDLQELEARLGAGDLDLPPMVLDYIQARHETWVPTPLGLLSRLRQRLRLGAGPQPPDPALESVVAFLEEQMEVEHARRTR